MDDRVLIYRGADQPDMSVINPESDVWQHIKTPLAYMATNWPVRHATISSDGRLVAVAGRRGLIHYSTASGRWKLFNDPVVEQSFIVRGGMIWFHHVLIVGVEASKTFQVNLVLFPMEDMRLITDRSACTRVIWTYPCKISFTPKFSHQLWSSYRLWTTLSLFTRQTTRSTISWSFRQPKPSNCICVGAFPSKVSLLRLVWCVV
jgi:hypothetical protein